MLAMLLVSAPLTLGARMEGKTQKEQAATNTAKALKMQQVQAMAGLHKPEINRFKVLQ